MPAFHISVRRLLSLALVSLIGGTLTPAFHAKPRRPQETTQPTAQETVVNLAAGSVLVAVSKGSIVIATIENPIEAGTHPPIPVQIGSTQVGVLLGAVDWIAPASKQQLARLDQELPHLRGREARTAPTLGGQAGKEASDIAAMGDGLFARLSALVENLHGKIDMPSTEPIAVLILADFVPNYGPEVWRVDYRIEQSEEASGYWTSRLLQPTYIQCWPPEKGHSRALLEFAFPASGSDVSGTQSLTALWLQQDPRLTKIAASDAHLGEAARGLLEEDSSKVSTVDALQFLRAALDAVYPRSTPEVIAVQGEESGFRWILPPPVEAATPGLRTERPAGAPSLVGPPQH